MSLTKAKRVLKYFDLTYVKNRAAYLLAANPPLDDVYNENDVATKIQMDQRPLPKRWNVEQLQGKVTCSEEPGLYLYRKFLSDKELQNIETFVKEASKENENGWFTYHKGRDMMPVTSMQRPEDNKRKEELRKLLLSLSSANNTDPDSWVSLNDYCNRNARIVYTTTSATSSTKGAEILASVQEKIQNGELLPKAKNEPCLFIQIQNVERGGVVGSHIDPVVKGGKTIATLIINGNTDVRVGNTIVRVEPGDIYGIEGHARYNIEHEVYSTVDDRLTATFRFGHDDTNHGV